MRVARTAAFVPGEWLEVAMTTRDQGGRTFRDGMQVSHVLAMTTRNLGGRTLPSREDAGISVAMTTRSLGSRIFANGPTDTL